MPVVEKDNFKALYEVSQTVNTILDPDKLLEKVLEIAMMHLEAERGFILLSDSTFAAGYGVTAARNAGGIEDPKTFAESSSVVKQVLATGESVLAFDALTDERFEASKSIVVQQILSVLCVPLRLGERTIGAVYLDSKKSRRAFTEESQQFISVFCALSAIAIDNARKFLILNEENQRLRNEVTPAHRFQGIIGESKQWQEVMEVVHRVSRTEVSVLITGESGTGKELVARAIHENGARSAAPFVAINCSAIPDTLLESELFGYKKGSFTGAYADKQGLFEAANHGTILLDEIGELSPLLQSKILRVLQEKELRRVGDVEQRKVDVRILAATNKDIVAEVKKNTFREDLLYRLNVVTIHLPALRSRKEDIVLLAEYFFKHSCEKHKRLLRRIEPQAMHELLLFPWPGNVRQLQNVIERAVVLCSGDSLTENDVVMDPASSPMAAGTTLAEYERQLIEATLQEMQGNRTRTAEKLGVSLRWLQYRLKEWNND